MKSEGKVYLSGATPAYPTHSRAEEPSPPEEPTKKTDGLYDCLKKHDDGYEVHPFLITVIKLCRYETLLSDLAYTSPSLPIRPYCTYLIQSLLSQ